MKKATKKVCGVYLIKCLITGRLYVGSSKDIKHRWSNHMSLLRNGKHSCKLLQADWNAYGEDNFEFEMVIDCLQRDLRQAEADYRNSCGNLYNKKNDDKAVLRFKKKTKVKMSQAQSGINNPRCKVSEYTVKRIKVMIEQGYDLGFLADMFSVSYGHISKIKNGYRWSDLKISDDERVDILRKLRFDLPVKAEIV